MFIKNGKKKARPMLAIGVGAMALYGAYSAVCSVKEMCVEKANMLTNVLKKNKKCEKTSENTCESDSCEM